MTPEELDAFLSEMEPDIKAADRDLREIEILEKRGVLGAGRLSGMLTANGRFQRNADDSFTRYRIRGGQTTSRGSEQSL